jgi:uncharacterized protein
VAEGTGKRIIKHIAWWRYAVDLWITRKIMTLRGEKLYELRGSCVRCGRCCEHPTIQMTEVAYHIGWIRNSIIWWQTHVNGFKLHKNQKFDALLVFTCSHFNPETRTCDAYSTRPGMCRDYPMNQAYSVNPTFFEECGFYAVDKRAKSFRAALEKTGLPPEKLEELYERLHLKD